MDSGLKERFARLGPIRAVDRPCSGSPGVIVLRLSQPAAEPRRVDAIMALARRGVSLLRAKRAVEALVTDGRVFVPLPHVEDPIVLLQELDKAGVCAALIDQREVDVSALRVRLGLSREQFALRYGLEVETVRNWEAGRRSLDAAARGYLQAIANDPLGVEQAYAPTPDLAR